MGEVGVSGGEPEVWRVLVCVSIVAFALFDPLAPASLLRTNGLAL